MSSYYSNWSQDYTNAMDPNYVPELPELIRNQDTLGAADLAMLTGYGKIPELEGLVQEWLAKADEGLNPANIVAGFLGALAEMSWWTEHEEGWRAEQELYYNDRATWQAKHDVYAGDITRFAEGLGYTLDEEFAASLATDIIRYGYTDSEIEREILNNTYYDQTDAYTPPETGTVRGEYDRIKRLASENLISVSDDWVWRQAHNVASEKTTGSSVDQQLVNLVKAQYSFMDPAIIDNLAQAQTTISDHLYPVLDQMRTTWGDPSLTFEDDWFDTNMIVKDEADGPDRFITAKEAQRKARQDDRYLTTDQNRQDMTSMSNAMMRVFGVL